MKVKQIRHRWPLIPGTAVTVAPSRPKLQAGQDKRRQSMPGKPWSRGHANTVQSLRPVASNSSSTLQGYTLKKRWGMGWVLECLWI